MSAGLWDLAARPDAAVWTRGLTFGPPSINGRFATLCSITPTSRRFITAQTRATFYCLPDALRRQGLTVSVCLPTLDVADTVGPIVERVRTELAERVPLVAEIVRAYDRDAKMARGLGVDED